MKTLLRYAENHDENEDEKLKTLQRYAENYDENDDEKLKTLLRYAGPEGSKVIKREVVVRNVGRE